jgi:hypothetical protein
VVQLRLTQAINLRERAQPFDDEKQCIVETYSHISSYFLVLDLSIDEMANRKHFYFQLVYSLTAVAWPASAWRGTPSTSGARNPAGWAVMARLKESVEE